MGEYLAPLGLEKIINQYFLGSQEILVGAFLITISYFCARYQMSNSMYLVILGLGLIMMVQYIGMSIYVLVLTIIAFTIFNFMKRMMEY